MQIYQVSIWRKFVSLNVNVNIGEMFIKRFKVLMEPQQVQIARKLDSNDRFHGQNIPNNWYIFPENYINSSQTGCECVKEEV